MIYSIIVFRYFMLNDFAMARGEEIHGGLSSTTRWEEFGFEEQNNTSNSILYQLLSLFYSVQCENCSMIALDSNFHFPVF